MNWDLHLSESVQNALELHSRRILVSEGDLRLSGADLILKAHDLKRFIEKTTVKKELVLISFPNSAAGAISLLAVLASDRIPVILSPTDFFGAQASVWLQRIKPALIISDRELNVEAHQIRNFHTLRLDSEGRVIQAVKSELNPILQSVPKGTGLVLFTSGSTGTPKGICVPEIGILETSKFLISKFDLFPESVSPIVLPICHSMGLNTHFFPTFFAGGESHFIDMHLQLPKLFRTVLSSGGTHVGMIGELLFSCLKEKNRRNLAPAFQVKQVQLAGGMILPEHLRAAQELFPNATLHKGYGLTEGIRVSMIDDRDEQFLSESVGFPLPFNQVEIRNEGVVVTDVNDTGEIWIQGPSNLLGILGQKETPHAGSSWMATGDLGHWNLKGQLCIVGRDDGLFKFNGNRVSGAEIEQTAIAASDKIRNAKCLLVKDQQLGKQKIVLFVEVARLDYSEQLGILLNNRLRTLAQPIKQVFFMMKFPTTSNGKVSLSRLREAHTVMNEAVYELKLNSPLQFYGLIPDRTAEA